MTKEEIRQHAQDIVQHYIDVVPMKQDATKKDEHLIKEHRKFCKSLAVVKIENKIKELEDIKSELTK